MNKVIRFDGAKLRKYRRGLRLTQYDIAPMIGISQNRVSDIERNVTNPTPGEMENIASALNMKISDFLSDEKDIVVITNTFSKKKKQQEQIQEFDDIVVHPDQVEQLELFPNEKLLVGADLAGYVLVKTSTYIKLIEDQEKLHKLQKLLK